MKRDMNLIRQILLWTEKQEHAYFSSNPNIEGYTPEQIGYHVYLMGQAGLVQIIDRSAMGMTSPFGIIREVTWAGHEFIDAIKDDALWNKATSTILKEGTSFTFESIKSWLTAQISQTLQSFPSP